MRKKQLIKLPEKSQMLDQVDKHFKLAILNKLKKKTEGNHVCESKDNMRTTSYQIETTNNDIEVIKK